MKKNRIALILVIVLTAFAAWLILRDSKTTIKKELRDFAVEDTAAITRIFMADRVGGQVDLKRQPDGSWLLNDTYPARQDMVDNLLVTLKLVTVKSPVSKAEFENTVKRLAGSATKVEVYQGGDAPVKVFYVGGSTQDTFGTYMMLENSSTPFITHIQGMNGYLSTRFFPDPESWRSTELFSYIPAELKKIEVNHSKPGHSFSISGINEGQPVVTNLENENQLTAIDTTAVYQYISLFQKVHGEYYATSLLRESQLDTIINNKLFTINLQTASGESKTLTFYRNQLSEPTLNVEGDTLLYDVDRGYGQVKGEDDIMVLQYFVFDPLTPHIDMFRPRAVKK